MPRVTRRSTKAGASTPATPPGCRASRSPTATLNEGRGLNPGDTINVERVYEFPPALNEGRGLNPGDTSSLSTVQP